MAFTIELDEQALAELKGLKRNVQVALVEAMKRHLMHQPTRQNRRSIRQLDPPESGFYRLRVGDYRIIYEVDHASSAVRVHAVRYKGRKTFDEISDAPGD